MEINPYTEFNTDEETRYRMWILIKKNLKPIRSKIEYPMSKMRYGSYPRHTKVPYFELDTVIDYLTSKIGSKPMNVNCPTWIKYVEVLNEYKETIMDKCERV